MLDDWFDVKGGPSEALNKKALAVTQRVQDKLTGRDFTHEELNIEQQVDRLIHQAMSHENLCQCYSKLLYRICIIYV